MAITKRELAAARTHLAAADPILAPLLSDMEPSSFYQRGDPFEALASSIVAQQLSVKAAASITDRICTLDSSSGFPVPETIAGTSPDRLRELGLSRAKATYLIDLSTRIISGELLLDDLAGANDDEVVSRLVEVKGIGRWTAEMFLIFYLGRLDVMPYGDLGIREAIRSLYDLVERPDQATIEPISDAWRPFRSVAALALWRSRSAAPPA